MPEKYGYVPGGDLSTVEGRRSVRAWSLVIKLRENELILLHDEERARRICSVIDEAFKLYLESEAG